MAVSSRGQDTWFSATGPGFESPYRYHDFIDFLFAFLFRRASIRASHSSGSVLARTSAGCSVVVFTGLGAYDAQRLKVMALASAAEEQGSYAVAGALALYRDFINLFLMLLRLFGGRRR